MMQKNSKLVIISNTLGLHARAAASFVKIAGRFQSEIFVSKGRTKVNGKSIMGLLMLAAGQGSQIRIETSGDDALAALDKLEKLVAKGFHEK